VSSVVEQNVLRLEISVDDIESVKMFKRQQQLRCVIPRPCLVEFAFPLQVVEQLASVHECQDQVELLFRLEGEFEGDDERAIDLREDCPFRKCVRDFGS